MIIRVGEDQKSVAKVAPHPRAVSRRLGLFVTSFQLLRAVSQTYFFFFFSGDATFYFKYGTWMCSTKNTIYWNSSAVI